MLLSIVIPVFNEEDNVDAFHARMSAVADSLEPMDVEMVFVDDGSVDRSLALLSRLAEKDLRVRIVKLARNFGRSEERRVGK